MALSIFRICRIVRNMKHKKHSKLVNDYDNQKRKHLEKLTDKMLKNDEYFNRLKEKTIDGDFLKLF